MSWKERWHAMLSPPGWLALRVHLLLECAERWPPLARPGGKGPGLTRACLMLLSPLRLIRITSPRPPSQRTRAKAILEATESLGERTDMQNHHFTCVRHADHAKEVLRAEGVNVETSHYWWHNPGEDRMKDNAQSLRCNTSSEDEPSSILTCLQTSNTRSNTNSGGANRSGGQCPPPPNISHQFYNKILVMYNY